MLFLYLISAVTVLLFIKFYLYKRRIMKYVGHLPAPPEIPIVGSGLYFLGRNSVGKNKNIVTFNVLSSVFNLNRLIESTNALYSALNRLNVQKTFLHFYCMWLVVLVEHQEINTSNLKLNFITRMWGFLLLLENT